MDLENKLNICELLDIYGALLTEKQSLIANSYYFDDISLSEIAINNDISRQAVYDSLNKTEAFLLDIEDKLQINEKNNSIKNQLKSALDVKDLEKLKKIIDNI